jgi:hypothetical protein
MVNKEKRAYVRQRSGLHLDLLNPDPEGWTDEDLAIGLSRTFRWGGHSIWPLPLSVAQHSISVLMLAISTSEQVLTRKEVLRELLHDADEALIGGFDAISPLKPFLGQGFIELTNKLQDAVFKKYELNKWSQKDHVWHKAADVLAAASEAVYVAGWESRELKEVLQIEMVPLREDPLVQVFNCIPWEPWTPDVAAERFLEILNGKNRKINHLINETEMAELKL